MFPVTFAKPATPFISRYSGELGGAYDTLVAGKANPNVGIEHGCQVLLGQVFALILAGSGHIG